MEHYIHEWPWEGQDNPQYVGNGPNLISWKSTSQQDGAWRRGERPSV